MGPKCRSGGESYCARLPHGPFHGALSLLYISAASFFLQFAAGSTLRVVHWCCHSRRVPIRRRAFRNCRELLHQVPVFASPNPQRVSHAGLAALHVPSFRTRTYQRLLIPRYIAFPPDLCYCMPAQLPSRTIQYLSHDPDVVKDNETDKLIRRSVSLRAVDDMLNRVCQAFQMSFEGLT